MYTGQKGIARYLIYFAVGLILVFSIPNGQAEYLINDYFACVVSYFYIFALFLFANNGRSIDIFDPIVMVTALFAALFIFEPIIDIREGDILWFGVDLMKYGVKATIIADLGYTAYILGYKNRDDGYAEDFEGTNREEKDPKVATYAVIGWIVCYAFTVVYLMSSGKTLAYIVSGGFMGTIEDTGDGSSLLRFISMFSYSLIGFWALYRVHGTNKLLSNGIYVLTLLSYWLRGFRFIILIFILVPVAYHYLKKGTRPKAYAIILMLFLLVVMIGITGYARGGLRSGEAVDYSGFNFQSDSLDQLKANFQIYKTYYGLVGTVPSEASFLFGQQMIVYTILMFIPRIIWSGKPSTAAGNALIKVAVSEYAFSAGTSYPCIGEYYIEFGIIGVFLCMLIFGRLNRKTISLLYSGTTEDNIMIYSILLFSNFQIIIRGYTPSNFYMVLFFLLPYIIKRMFISTERNMEDIQYAEENVDEQL